MFTIPELLARADDCERLAENSEFGRQRSLLLELAAKWRRLADCTDGEQAGTGTAPPSGSSVMRH